MSSQLSTSTKLFFEELTKQSKLTKSTEDGKRRKLYEGNTSNFEPTEENREHLIKDLMPLVAKIAKSIAFKYKNKVEIEDCQSAGLQGAIDATDRYIKNSKIKKQPAKLSSFAYPYIVKYVNEYCWQNNSILSYGHTKWEDACNNTIVSSGNESAKSRNGNNDGNDEMFDYYNHENLQCAEFSIEEKTDVEAKKWSNQLFGNLSKFDKQVVFLSFGIGQFESEPLEPQAVAKRLKCSKREVRDILAVSLEKMRNNIGDESIPEALKTLRESNLSKTDEWKL
jgi:RNA polymerase sigma factor (sigma-70 family)